MAGAADRPSCEPKRPPRNTTTPQPQYTKWQGQGTKETHKERSDKSPTVSITSSPTKLILFHRAPTPTENHTTTGNINKAGKVHNNRAHSLVQPPTPAKQPTHTNNS